MGDRLYADVSLTYGETESTVISTLCEEHYGKKEIVG